METKTLVLTGDTTITAQAMSTLCIEDVLTALCFFARPSRPNCFDCALACDRNHTSFWLIRENGGTIKVCLQHER